MKQSMAQNDIFSTLRIDNSQHYSANVSQEKYFGFPMQPILSSENKLLDAQTRSAAYFSMEYGLSCNSYNVFESATPISPKNFSPDHNVFSNLRAMDYYLSVDTGRRMDLPIFSGGLGVLAGDTLKSAADRKVSLAAIGILWNKGYFKQNFWFKDGQIPEEMNWDPRSFPGLVPLKEFVELELKHEKIRLRLWKYFVYGYDKSSVVPLILLDSNLPENSPMARQLTDQLYRSDNAQWKILQRVILGMGGVKALEKLGYHIHTYHLNEGHAALAFTQKAISEANTDHTSLKERFAYTCHTPVEAGHDRFSLKALADILKDEELELVKQYGMDPHQRDVINLTYHAMNTCNHVNAVAQKHGEVTRVQFPEHAHRIAAITNGVHHHTWMSESIQTLLDEYTNKIGDWRANPTHLKEVQKLKSDGVFREKLWLAHQVNKKHLCSLLKSWQLKENVFTICWARRIASYKRPSLLLQDVQRLIQISRTIGPIQILFAGKAHPKDDLGFTRVNEMLGAIDSLENQRSSLRVLMLENYDTYLGKVLASGVDVWLNNPLPPFEASGTSGMKAILNGVLQLSTLDGWVVEAADKDIGWIFGWAPAPNEVGDERDLRLEEDAERLYENLEKVVTLYYHTLNALNSDVRSAWIDKMINSISEGAFFNTDRMAAEYQEKIWNS